MLVFGECFFLVRRPVPLEHYIFPAGGDGLHLVVDNKGRFRENNFQVTCCLQPPTYGLTCAGAVAD